MRGMKLRKKQKTALLLVLALAPIIIFAATKGIPTLASMVFGYEGSKIYVDKVCIHGDCYPVGSAPPPGASEFRIASDNWNIDLDDECGGMQNFVGSADTNGKYEQTPLGMPIVDQVEWTKQTVDEQGNIVHKKFRGQIWYFDHTITMMTRVDECQLGGLVTYSTEKTSPVRDATVGFWVHVENWAPEGNNTPQNFAAILGVEVIEVKTYYMKDGQMVEGVAPGTSVHVDVFPGQMLSLKGRESISGREYKAYLESAQPDISPDPNLSKDAYFEIHISELGAMGGAIFDEWHEPVVQVKLRVHVLKVDSWIAIQRRGEPPRPPDWGEANPFQGIAEWISKTFGIPLSIAGWALLFIFLFFVFALVLIILGAVAVNLGVRGAVRGGGGEG